MDLEAFLDEAAPHIARWHSLRGEVVSPQSLESALAPLTTALPPCLESLELSLYWDDPMSQNAISLFGGAPAPSTLNDIYLYRIPLAFEPLRLSGLGSLGLKQVESISTPELLQILRGSPQLETLTLAKNPKLVAIGSQPSTMQPIELPKLVSLVFEWIDHGGTNSIISSIRTPNRRQLYIRDTIDRDSAWSVLFTPSIRHILHTNTPTADPPPSVIEVEIYEEDDCAIRFGGVVLTLLVYREDRVLRTLAWLVDRERPRIREKFSSKFQEMFKGSRREPSGLRQRLRRQLNPPLLKSKSPGRPFRSVGINQPCEMPPIL
ncbi:hypothetical protein FS837_000406 [Tulasnella sp. UAMH 9824]|nr:hypothetical protein FS837_000406 [Tulasnella sp. UAMH 9824]